MKGSKFTEEQIAFAFKQAESGITVAEVCRKMGLSENTPYAWRKKFSGLGVSELRRLRQLEEEIEVASNLLQAPPARAVQPYSLSFEFWWIRGMTSGHLDTSSSRYVKHAGIH